ncbi:MAG: hypothetical protein EBU93_05570, partial [Chlamydiae bacterium]|nr:hypothetical protein [Chlamydiota bacterium]
MFNAAAECYEFLLTYPKVFDIQNVKLYFQMHEKMRKQLFLIFYLIGPIFQNIYSSEASISYFKQTKAIEAVEAVDPDVIESYNDRGISYFFDNDLQAALTDFNYVLEQMENDAVNKEVIACALWGRMLVHAYLGMEGEAF